MSGDVWLVETYFMHLMEDAFGTASKRREYEGVSRCLHDIPFYWTEWSDENRAGDAHAFRQWEFLDVQPGLDKLDQVWLGQFANATPSVFEVLLGMSRRWAFYFEAHEPWWYFWQMFNNLELNYYPGKHLSLTNDDEVRGRIDLWLSREFKPSGKGSPFPCTKNTKDMSTLPIWDQMNAYSAEHFQ